MRSVVSAAPMPNTRRAISGLSATSSGGSFCFAAATAWGGSSGAKRQLELDGALRELVLAAEVPVEPGTMTFHFVTRKNKLRRLDLSEAQARLLSEGKLAIVERQDPDKIEHALVPPATAEQMRSL